MKSLPQRKNENPPSHAPFPAKNDIFPRDVASCFLPWIVNFELAGRRLPEVGAYLFCRACGLPARGLLRGFRTIVSHAQQRSGSHSAGHSFSLCGANRTPPSSHVSASRKTGGGSCRRCRGSVLVILSSRPIHFYDDEPPVGSSGNPTAERCCSKDDHRLCKGRVSTQVCVIDPKRNRWCFFEHEGRCR